MNKVSCFLMLALLLQAQIFCMDNQQAELLSKELDKLCRIFHKAQAFPEVQEYQHELALKRLVIKGTFPQNVTLRDDDRIVAEYTLHGSIKIVII